MTRKLTGEKHLSVIFMSLISELIGSNVLFPGFRLFLRTHRFTSKNPSLHFKEPVNELLCERFHLSLIILKLLVHTFEKKNLFLDL